MPNSSADKLQYLKIDQVYFLLTEELKKCLINAHYAQQQPCCSIRKTVSLTKLVGLGEDTSINFLQLYEVTAIIIRRYVIRKIARARLAAGISQISNKIYYS